jgi:hypothetical protein
MPSRARLQNDCDLVNTGHRFQLSTDNAQARPRGSPCVPVCYNVEYADCYHGIGAMSMARLGASYDADIDRRRRRASPRARGVVPSRTWAPHGHRTLTASTRDEALALLDVADGITVLFTDLGLHGELDVPEGPNERDDRRALHRGPVTAGEDGDDASAFWQLSETPFEPSEKAKFLAGVDLRTISWGATIAQSQCTRMRPPRKSSVSPRKPIAPYATPVRASAPQVDVTGWLRIPMATLAFA